MIYHRHQHPIFRGNVATEYQRRPDFGSQTEIICQTSPRFAFGMAGLSTIQGADAFGGNGHHLVVAQVVIHLGLQLAGKPDLLAFRQPGEGLFQFNDRAPGKILNQLL